MCKAWWPLLSFSTKIGEKEETEAMIHGGIFHVDCFMAYETIKYVHT